MGKKSSNSEGVHAMGARVSAQLELSFVRKSSVSSNVIAFPKSQPAHQSGNSSDSALKRLLDHAATLPGK